MRKLTTIEFISRSVKVHGAKYDYSKSVYVTNRKKVIIMCDIHGDFTQEPAEHLRGGGCIECGNTRSGKVRRDLCKNNRPELINISIPEGSVAINIGNEGEYSIIDSEDYTSVSLYNWCNDGKGYAINNTVGYMHRFIMFPPPEMLVDHINHNTMDNRRCNLRICTSQENLRNMRPRRGTSRYKGVSYDKRRNSWQSKINIGGKTSNIGSFSIEEDAARAYDKKAIEIFGEFANINFK